MGEANRGSRAAIRLQYATSAITIVVAALCLLPRFGIAALLLLVMLRWLAGLVHECGHVAAAMLVRWRPTMLLVRPIRAEFTPFRLSVERGYPLHFIGSGRAEYLPRPHGRATRGFVAAGGVTAAALTVTFLTIYSDGRLTSSSGVINALTVLLIGDIVAALIPAQGTDGMELLALVRDTLGGFSSAP